jgi:general secretion pathway protein K
MTFSPFHKQRGTVLIITLWTITLLTILVTVLASQSRLSARATQFHQDELANWANVVGAVNQAEMELMLDLMDPPVLTPEEQAENPVPLQYRNYRGAPLQLTYPQAEDVVVRVYNHAGKINLAELSRPRLRALLEKKLGDDAEPGQLDDLLAAWADWLDLNDQAAPNGAEEDYYLEQDLPYEPRNGRLETVEEILNIKGFAEVFADVDMDAAFTVYGDSDLINLNVATVEAMRLLPGLDEDLIDEIIAWRETSEFVGNGDVAQLVPAENMAELRPWLNSRRPSSHYTIMAYRRETPDNTDATIEDGTDADALAVVDKSDPAITAYAEIVEVASFNNKPRVLKINPYQNIPIRKVAAADVDPAQ